MCKLSVNLSFFIVWCKILYNQNVKSRLIGKQLYCVVEHATQYCVFHALSNHIYDLRNYIIILFIKYCLFHKLSRFQVSLDVYPVTIHWLPKTYVAPLTSLTDFWYKLIISIPYKYTHKYQSHINGTLHGRYRNYWKGCICIFILQQTKLQWYRDTHNNYIVYMYRHTKIIRKQEGGTYHILRYTY